jgi:hypothetical protein
MSTASPLTVKGCCQASASPLELDHHSSVIVLPRAPSDVGSLEHRLTAAPAGRDPLTELPFGATQFVLQLAACRVGLVPETTHTTETAVPVSPAVRPAVRGCLPTQLRDRELRR